jgi:hypothetical protein
LPFGEIGVLNDPLTSPFQHLGLDVRVMVIVGLGRKPVQYISPLYICEKLLV